MLSHRAFMIYKCTYHRCEKKRCSRLFLLRLINIHVWCFRTNYKRCVDKAEEHVVKIEKEYCKENCIDRSVIEPIIIDFYDDDSDDDAG